MAIQWQNAGTDSNIMYCTDALANHLQKHSLHVINLQLNFTTVTSLS
uniref:Uncharacterized protein n=1 Tax=Anguilla anguilla TaxID=7936 RepID=A0A0E9W5B5_ANGAN